MSTKDDMARAVAKIQKAFSPAGFQDEYAYCAIFVLSHGTVRDGKEFISCGNESTDHFSMKADILTQLTHDDCPYLRGRPLIGVVRVCRGTNYNVIGTDSEFQLVGASRTPRMPDMYILYSTPEGFYDSSSANKGSLFIREFCEGVQRHDDIEKIAKGINEKECLRLVENPQNGTRNQSVLQTSAGPVQLKKCFKFF